MKKKSESFRIGTPWNKGEIGVIIRITEGDEYPYHVVLKDTWRMNDKQFELDKPKPRDAHGRFKGSSVELNQYNVLGYLGRMKDKLKEDVLSDSLHFVVIDAEGEHKLYTEEQVEDKIKKALEYGFDLRNKCVGKTQEFADGWNTRDKVEDEKEEFIKSLFKLTTTKTEQLSYTHIAMF